MTPARWLLTTHLLPTRYSKNEFLHFKFFKFLRLIHRLAYYSLFPEQLIILKQKKRNKKKGKLLK